MKTKLLALSLVALFTLTACGGGGGGGGGGGKGGLAAPAAINWWGAAPVAPHNAGTGSTVTNPTDAFSVGTKTMAANTTFSTLGGGSTPFAITKTADGLVLSAGGGMGRSSAVTVSAGDFKDTSSDFITAVKESTGRFSDNPSFSYKAQDTIVLGGKKLTLSYSDFGLWNSYERVVQDGQGPDDGFAATSFIAFSMGDDNQKANFASGSGAQNFTGKTVAVAHGGGQADVSRLTGTANMSFTAGGGAINTNLGLSFAGFGNFTIPVTVNGSTGAISASNTSVTASGAYDGRNMTAPTASVGGQFYGSAPNNPSEAVGQYVIQSSDTQYTTINGSFGMTGP